MAHQTDYRRRLRDAATERRCASQYLHTWAMALRGRGWSAADIEKKLFALARDIAAGAHVADPDGSGRPA